MDALLAIVSVAAVIALVVGAIKLVGHWHVVEAQRRQAEAWDYLTWETTKLKELHNKFIDLIAAGNRKPAYYRSIEAIKEALEMRQRLSAAAPVLPPQ